MPNSFIIFLTFILSINTACQEQAPVLRPQITLNILKDTISKSNPENEHYLNGRIYHNAKDLPKGIISATMTDQYPSTTFHFYNDQGEEVKTIREDQFPINNPIFGLPFPKKNDKEDSWSYYSPLSLFDDKTGKEKPQVSVAEKVKAFNALRKYNLRVRAPETATDIIGSPEKSRIIVTPPLSKYLVRFETASIYYAYAKENHDIDGNTLGNSLLDCSYITVYNHVGKVANEILVPDKIIRKGYVSDDGKYLFCGYTFGFIWDEGASQVSGGFMVIDLQNQKIIPINIPDFQGCSGDVSGFFAEGFFQMQCEGRKFLYVNPYIRTYYMVQYERDQIRDNKSTLYSSFTPFENVKVDLAQLQKYTY